MKKIISVLVVVALLAVGVIAALPTSAAAVKTYNVDWSALDYNTYAGSDGVGELRGDGSEYESMFNVEKTTSSIKSTRVSGNSEAFYVATTTFDLTSTTQYEYTFKVKNNNATLYAGVPYAIEGNTVYMIYGSFNNTSDDYNGTKSELRFCKGSFDWEYPSTDNKVFPALTLDGSGFSTLTVKYDGLSVSFYAGSTKLGQTITLPTGSKLAMGVYSRDADNGKDRTLTVKDAVVSAMNNDAAAYLNVDTNGIGALKTLVNSCKTDYANEADYTAASYGAYKTALTAAEAVIAKGATATKAEVSSAKTALETAILGLEILDAADLDFSKLDEAIAKAEALKAVEYTDISFKMVTDAVTEAKALKEKADAKQSDINAMVEKLTGRIDGLVPSGEIAPPEEDADGDADADAPATDAPAADGSATDAPIVPAESGSATAPTPAAKKGGCGSAVATTAVVVGLVATLGTALVVKKKD